MVFGPLTRVGTLVARIDADVSKMLNWDKSLTLEFITVDKSEPDDWKVWATLTRGFDRVIDDERTTDDGSDVILEVVDEDAILGPILRKKDLHVRVDDIIYKVGQVPPLPPNVAQVYTLTCKTRTLRANFDTTSG